MIGIEEQIFKEEILKKLNKQEFQNKGYRKFIEENFEFDQINKVYNLKSEIDTLLSDKVKHILKTISYLPLETLDDVAVQLRDSDKKYTLIYAFNGVGKTRLSVAFKNKGKIVNQQDTIYFNAFTEDLFYWENDLEGDIERHLNINLDSDFFVGLHDLDISNKIRPILRKYVDYNFDIDFTTGKVYFQREIIRDGISIIEENIKISRGEESIFIWSFFSAVVQLVVDGERRYNWVKYIYIDDPISSLDDQNAIAVAHYLAKLVKASKPEIKIIISTHHSLFYNVLCNEFKNATKLLLSKKNDNYELKDTTDTPFIYHITIIKEIQKAIDEDRLVNYHFTILRNLLEKAANFHGFNGFENLIVINDDDPEKTLYNRFVQIFNHGGYSLFEPTPLNEDNKKRFVEIFENFKKNYKFNEDEIFIKS